jgi:hypothetical protein
LKKLVAVIPDGLVHLVEDPRPVEPQVPAEEGAHPARRDRLLDHVRGHLEHGDDADGDRGDREDGELHDLGDDDADHAAFDGVEGGQAENDDGVDVLVGEQAGGVAGEMPGQHDHRELADALEGVGEHADHQHQRKEHHADMGHVRPRAPAEAGLNPLGAGQHVRAPQPRAQEHHQEDLVEHRPEKRQPDALHPVHEEPVDHQHRAADIEHAGGVRDPQHVPRQRLAAQEVGVQVLGAPARGPEPDQDHHQEVADDDGDIEGMQFHAR